LELEGKGKEKEKKGKECGSFPKKSSWDHSARKEAMGQMRAGGAHERRMTAILRRKISKDKKRKRSRQLAVPIIAHKGREQKFSALRTHKKKKEKNPHNKKRRKKSWGAQQWWTRAVDLKASLGTPTEFRWGMNSITQRKRWGKKKAFTHDSVKAGQGRVHFYCGRSEMVRKKKKGGEFSWGAVRRESRRFWTRSEGKTARKVEGKEGDRREG